MKISIVISTYNHLNDCLKPCIESIIKTTNAKDIEIIVVANGCTDGTKEYLNDLYEKGAIPFFTWYDQPLGFPKANNEGICMATGDYIVLLNNDTVLLANNWINILLQPFLIDPKVGITGPTKFTFDCAGITKEAMAFWCVMIKKEVFDEIGLLDEIFYPFGSEDVDFSIRAVNAGYRLVQVPIDTPCKFLVESPRSLGVECFPIYHRGSTTIDEHFNDSKKKQDLENRNMKIICERYGPNAKA